MDSILDDLINTDYNEVSTEMPLITPGTYEFTIKGAELHTNEERGSESFKITLGLAEVAETAEGGEVNVGFPITTFIGITPSEKYSVDSIKAAIKKFGISYDSEFQFTGDFDEAIGQTITAKVGVQGERQVGDKTYAPSNTIDRFIPLD